MFGNVVFFNSYFELIEENEQYFVRFQKKGMEVGELNKVLTQFPRLQVTEFTALKSASLKASGNMIMIGTKRPKMEIRISKDRMKAYLKLNMTDDEFASANKEALVREVIDSLVSEGVIFGYDIKSILQNLKLRREYEVAEGILPTKGEDAVLKYYDLAEPKPKVHSDGKVDHYELELINNVEKGEWLGERTEPTMGIPGKTVYGEVLPGRAGHQEPLKYDPKSIEEVFKESEKKTYLYAMKRGAVIMENEKLSVCNYLEIEGRVSFKTGNIDFDGFVGVTDTVEDNFSIIAEKDIQVLGALGVGAVDTIESREGNIYIKGGIAGKNKAKIICNGNLYTKFASDCTIECEGTVSIGFYAMNCNIKAKEVVMESSKSRLIGGHIEADIKVVSAEVGNRTEIPTSIKINGFNRDEMKEKHDMVLSAIEQYNTKLQSLNLKMAIYKKAVALNDEETKEYEKLSELSSNLTKNLDLLKANNKQFKSYLQTKGEGEIRITRKLHNNVRMGFKGSDIMSQASDLPVTYFIRRNEIIVD